MATLSTETNTFSSVPTEMADYAAYFLRHGTATQEPPNLMTEALHLWRNRAEALNWQVTESLSAIAEPAGRTTRTTYDTLIGEILDDLKAADIPDVILLQLHGAMLAEGEDDCEGALVEQIRALCPNAVIGVSLDLHCHLRDRLLDAADLVITFKEYPHDDASARAAELFDLAHRTLKGDITPVMALFDCRMVSLFMTKTPQMVKLVADLRAAEQRPRILSVSLGHGFPWADLKDTGARMIVISDGDQALAEQTAEELGMHFYNMRHALLPEYPDLETALADVARAKHGPIVLADMSDNAGAGAPGDSTFVLAEILARGMSNAATAIHFDPEAVGLCQKSGEGAGIVLDLGGKHDAVSGSPLTLKAKVKAIKYGLGQHLGLGIEPLGTMVWLQLENDIDVLISDLRIQVYNPEVFEQMGVVLARKRLVVVKSLFHFYTSFAAIARNVIFCATPGLVNPDTTRIAYTQRDMNFWPAVDDPFASKAAHAPKQTKRTA